MKISILLTAGAFVLAACSKSPEKKAEHTIKTFMEKNLDDPKSYDPIEFSRPDSAFTKYYVETEEGSRAWKQYIKYRNHYDSLVNEKSNDTSTYRKIYMQQDSIYSKKQDEFNGKGFIGYNIDHTYRAKNKVGALVKDRNTFVLNATLDSVITVK